MAIVTADGSGNEFAEKLGLWIDFTDAITLSAVHNDSVVNPPGLQAETQPVASAASAELDRVKSILVNSIKASFLPASDMTDMNLPEQEPALTMDHAAAYLPYRRFYEAHQREMELSIRSLKIKVRGMVATVSPKLKKLADLDATLENILRDRESKLLSRVPVLLGKHFERLFKEHQKELNEPQQAATQAEGWLTRFCKDMQKLLLAEVELRLQPALGLIEATTQKPQLTT